MKGYADFIRGKKNLKLLFKGYQFELFDCPGLWMGEEQLKTIQKRIIRVTLNTCGKHPTRGLYVNTNLMKDKVISICSQDGVDYAFNAMVRIGKYHKTDVLHTGPAYCSRQHQGIVTRLFFLSLTYFFLKNYLKKFYITTISHVPKVFGLMVDSFSHVYPNENPYFRPTRIHIGIRDLLLNSYVKEIEPEYQYRVKDDFILKGFRLQKDGSLVPYSHTAETVPRHRFKKFNDRCLNMINYEAGDALIMVGEVGLKEYFINLPKIMKKRRPIKSIGQV